MTLKNIEPGSAEVWEGGELCGCVRRWYDWDGTRHHLAWEATYYYEVKTLAGLLHRDLHTDHQTRAAAVRWIEGQATAWGTRIGRGVGK